jgi:hypothetical protein
MKLTIVGRGTVGCMSILHFLRWTDWEIEWIYDPNIPPTFVGEGTTLTLPKSLYQNAWFSAKELEEMNSTVKLGIHKKNWGIEGKEFIHSFAIGDVGIHFSAVTFQDLVMRDFGKNLRIKHIEASVVPDNIDADYVLMCTGSPKELTDEYESFNHIPVNTAFVSQCPWDYARFNYSLTFARPYGWIFGIPLKNRCAIGYLYNDKINTLDEVKEDVKQVLKELNLTPEVQRQLSFKIEPYIMEIVLSF